LAIELVQKLHRTEVKFIYGVLLLYFTKGLEFKLSFMLVAGN